MSSLKAPESNAVPQTLGSGAPSQGQGDRPDGTKGAVKGAGMVGRGALQEARVAGDAWSRLARTLEGLVTIDVERAERDSASEIE